MEQIVTQALSRRGQLDGFGCCPRWRAFCPREKPGRRSLLQEPQPSAWPPRLLEGSWDEGALQTQEGPRAELGPALPLSCSCVMSGTSWASVSSSALGLGGGIEGGGSVCRDCWQ